MLRDVISRIAALNRAYDRLERRNPTLRFMLFVVLVLVPVVGLGFINVLAQAAVVLLLLVVRLAWIEGWIDDRPTGEPATD